MKLMSKDILMVVKNTIILPVCGLEGIEKLFI